MRAHLSPYRLIALASILAVLTACGSAGTSGATAGPPVASSSATKGQAQFLITIPHATSGAASARRPQYVSPATQSISVNITGTSGTANPAGFPQTANLTPTSTGCSTSLANTQCTLVFSLNPGTYAATIATYDQTGGTGNLLSGAQAVPFSVLGGQTNTVGLVLAGVPASTLVFPVNATSTIANSAIGGYDLRYPGNHAFYVESLDADSNFIIGAGAPTFAIGTASGLAGATVITSPSTPNLFTVALPVALTAGNFSFTVTPTFAGQATNGCTQSGANCSPITMNVDMVGTVYVGYGFTNAVVAFDENANPIPVSGSFAGIDNPSGMAYVPSTGFLYVLNYGVNHVGTSVTVYDLNGNVQTTSGTFPSLNTPYAITYDPVNGLLYVANFGAIPGSSSDVTAYDLQGNLQALSGAFPGLNGPLGITYDAQNGLIYVVNFGTVVAFTPNGVPSPLSGAITTPGAQANIVYDPSNEYLYVNSGSGMNVYDGNGNAQTLTGTFAQSYSYYTMAFDPHNGFFYDPLSTSGVSVYDQQGNLQTLPTTFPVGAAHDNSAIAIVP
jgi:hypothetical protein